MVHSTINTQKKINDLGDLKSSFDCREYGRMMLGQPKRSNPRRDTYYAPHRDDGQKASFVISHDGFKDWGGDGKSGSILDLIMLLENLTLPQAIERLQDLVGNRPVNAPQRPRQERPAANEPPPANWQYAAINFIEHGQRELFKNEAVLNYLRYERDLTDETIRAAGLGWNPEARMVGGFWVEAGIVIPRYQDGTLWLVNIRTVTGSFAAYLGVPSHTRRNGEAIDKYICMAGSKLIGSIFNADALRPGRPILFVEGELDAILAQQELGEAVSVVTLGGATNRNTPTWKSRILALDTPIYIALDGDGAGQDATRHLITELGEKATALKYPAGIKDLTDFVNAGGDVRAWFEAQTNSRVYADGAPASIVSAMLTYTEPGNALIFAMSQDAARAGAIDPKCFKASDLLEWGWQNNYPIPKSSFYRYLEYELMELVPKCKALSLYPTGVRDNALQNGNKSVANRPAEYYSMVELSQLQKAIRRQSWARLYDAEFKTDGKKGVKARPRIAGLKRLGVPNAAAVAAGLDKKYQSIYQRQRWAHRYAEKRIQEKHAAIIADLADPTPLKTQGYLIKRDSDLIEPIIQSFLQPGQPISLKQIAQKTGQHYTRVGQNLRRLGWEGQRSESRIVPIKRGQDIRQAAIEADSHAQWRGLLIDDNPEIQPFEQAIANRATKSVAMVIQPPNTYTFVGKPEPVEIPAPAPAPIKIDIEQSKAAPEYKPAPYFGDDVNPEVDYNQLVLGLTLSGWTYEKQSGFWIDPTEKHICRTMTEAVQLQAGIPIEPAPTVDSAPAPAEIQAISDPPGVESLPPSETPENDDFFIPPETWFAELEF